MGDLPQRKRLDLIDGIKEGRIKLLVATDVAARGLHIDDLDLVVNYDVPEDFELYVHRIGRTARAGKTGKAITLACERYVYGLEAIESFIGQKIPVVWPDEKLFKEDASAGMSFSERRSSGPSSRSDRGRNGRPRSERSRASGDSSNRSRQRSGGRYNGSRAPGGNAAGTGHRDRQRPAAENAAPSGTKPPGDASLEDRLSYYRQKYGEDFQMNRASTAEPGRSRGGSGSSNEAARQAGGGGSSSRGSQGGHRGQSGQNRNSGRSGQGNRQGNRSGQHKGGVQNAGAKKKSASIGTPARNGQRDTRAPQPLRAPQGNGKSPSVRTPNAKQQAAGSSEGLPMSGGLVAKLKRLFKRQ